MPSSTLLKNATLTMLHPPSLQHGEVRIQNGKITETGSNLPSIQNETVIDLNKKLLLPGFVCAHTHLYSSLARGMPPPSEPPRSFLEILQKVWWRLDRALDEENIYYSALIGALEAVRCGTTTLIDHHASPNCIDGSLDLIEKALIEVGIRGVLCYEVTDRGGKKKRQAGLDENERFLKKERPPLLGGLVGAHASFTLDDESLAACSDMARQHNTGVHIHVAEDPCDTVDTRRRFKKSVIDRLKNVGALHSKSLLAHNIHLSTDELSQARESSAWLLHNPRSNMNNRVGHASIDRFGSRSTIGTDGFPADMLFESQLAYFKAQDAQRNVSPNTIIAMLQQGNDLVSEIFNQTFGAISPGAVADLIVLDYRSPTPFEKSNLAGHLLFGMRSSLVESVMVNGEWIILDRQWQNVDIQQAYANAIPVARKLWQKMEEMK